ncbi:MAG: hypothetical protein KatS3mg023_3246 [Armatimonadota bacterium]|nr:MAG: hypothetical protein KatS3mg023_3246 [Armatimonadota bacterium]
MSFDWVEFLALARNLQGRSGASYSTEAANRTAVSRAYYAAFCHARNYAENRLGFRRTGTGRDHKLLRDHLRTRGTPWDEICEYLEDLQKWRGQCDYDDMIQNMGILVSNAIDTAEKIIEQCR